MTCCGTTHASIFYLNLTAATPELYLPCLVCTLRTKIRQIWCCGLKVCKGTTFLLRSLLGVISFILRPYSSLMFFFGIRSRLLKILFSLPFFLPLLRLLSSSQKELDWCVSASVCVLVSVQKRKKLGVETRRKSLAEFPKISFLQSC